MFLDALRLANLQVAAVDIFIPFCNLTSDIGAAIFHPLRYLPTQLCLK